MSTAERVILTPYSVAYRGTTFPLSLHLSIQLFSPEENMYEIELTVPLPEEYPMESQYKQKKHRVAYLSLYYYVTKKQLEIDLFYVYNNRTKYKKDIGEHDTFHTKGLGKYMLCKAVHYLLDHTDWFDINSTVTLVASGEECAHPEQYSAYTIDECLAVLYQYDDPSIKLFELVISHYYQELIDALPVEAAGNIHLFYQQNSKRVDGIIKGMLDKKNRAGDTLLRESLQKLVCYIKTNQQLIEKNYRDIYGFRVVKNNGTYATMEGTVYSILSACYGKKVTMDNMVTQRTIQKNTEAHPLLGNRRHSCCKCKRSKRFKRGFGKTVAVLTPH
jgi:hypothetical protein